MPSDLAQPVVPLAFMGEVDLAEVGPVVRIPHLPSDGTLAFFYAWPEGSWGFDPAARGHCRVCYTPATEATSPIPAPADLPDEAKFPRRGLGFAREWTLPSRIEHSGVKLSYWGNDEYRNLCHRLMPGDDDTPFHRVGGNPQEIQGEMRLECQLVTNGIYCGDSSGYRDPRVPALTPGAADWQLLLQIDSDGTWMWGDMGRLYFWARQQDIARSDFSGAWAILQCH